MKVAMSEAPKKQYFAVPGSRLNDEDARILGPEIDRLGGTKGASAPEIVREAEDPESLLHPYFEWDDSEAAQRYRETQARTLVHGIAVTIVGSDGNELKSARAFVAVADNDSARPKRYVNIEVVAKDAEKSAEVFEEARREFIGRARKYEGYRQLFKIEDKLLYDVLAVIDRLKEEG